MSTENISENLREKFGRFRILIVGRANAGKTTILQRMCNTTENPEIYDGDGNKIDLSQVEGTRGVGIAPRSGY
jgi:GTPase SAR1 family protein